MVRASTLDPACAVILERLREGAVTLTSVALLRPVLTEENHARLLGNAAGRTKREVECLVRALAPRPDMPVSIRRVSPAPIASRPPGAASDRVRVGIAPPSSEEDTTDSTRFPTATRPPFSIGP